MDSFSLSFVHPKQDPRNLSYLARTLYTASLQARYHGRLALREKLCEECLALCHELADKSGMAVVLHEMGQIAYQRGRSQEAISLYGKSLALFQEQGDQYGRAETLLSLAGVQQCWMDYASARQFIEESLHLFRLLDNRPGIAKALGRLAFIVGYDQRHLKALSLAEESLEMLRNLDEPWETADQLHNVAELALRLNNYILARNYAEEGQALALKIGYRKAAAHALYLLARVFLRLQSEKAPFSLLEESLTICRELENQEGAAFILCDMAHQAWLRRDLLLAQDLCEQSFSIFLAHTHRAGLINSICQLAYIVTNSGRPLWGTRLLAAGEAVREAVGLQPMMPIGAYRRLSAHSLTSLSWQNFTCAWQEGLMMTPEEAFANREEHSSLSTGRAQHATQAKTSLTRRECEVLHLLTQGFTNPQIAERLIVSPTTVNAHVRSLYTKLNVSSRSAATRYAFEHHLC